MRKDVVNSEHVTIEVEGTQAVSGLLMRPPDAVACYVMAHGAGAGMDHPFMTACAIGLAERGIATLRYQFPYMQRGSRRPDSPGTCHMTVRAAVDQANSLRPALPLIAGGRSFGGRMTSQAQAIDALPGVLGLAFLGFPLHPAGKPSVTRAAHLESVRIPMLFLQGSRDALASQDLIRPLVDRLAPRSTLHLLEGADHSFHVLARSGRNDADVRIDLLSAFSQWTSGTLQRAVDTNPAAGQARG